MATVDVDGSCHFSADSQPKLVGLVCGLAAIQHLTIMQELRLTFLGMVALQNSKIVLHSVYKLAYDCPKRVLLALLQPAVDVRPPPAEVRVVAVDKTMPQRDTVAAVDATARSPTSNSSDTSLPPAHRPPTAVSVKQRSLSSPSLCVSHLYPRPVFENTHFRFFQISKKHDFLRFFWKWRIKKS